MSLENLGNVIRGKIADLVTDSSRTNTSPTETAQQYINAYNAIRGRNPSPLPSFMLSIDHETLPDGFYCVTAFSTEELQRDSHLLSAHAEILQAEAESKELVEATDRIGIQISGFEVGNCSILSISF